MCKGPEARETQSSQPQRMWEWLEPRKSAGDPDKGRDVSRTGRCWLVVENNLGARDVGHGEEAEPVKRK